jgi:hypothetical protein
VALLAVKLIALDEVCLIEVDMNWLDDAGMKAVER